MSRISWKKITALVVTLISNVLIYRGVDAETVEALGSNINAVIMASINVVTIIYLVVQGKVDVEKVKANGNGK